MRSARRLSLLMVLTLFGLPPGLAHAGGYELLPGGTRSVARGGAVAARPEDPMALLHNPAGLVLLPGDQFMIDVDVPLFDMCVDLYGYYGWGVYTNDKSEFNDPLNDTPKVKADAPPVVGSTYATTPLPEVCNTGKLLPIPQIAMSFRVSDDLALGVGLILAPTVVPGSQFGGNDGTIQTEYGPAPSPTRYQLIGQQVGAFAPSVGGAYSFMPSLQVGLGVQVLMLKVKTRAIQNATSGTQPSKDWLATVTASDYFLPSLTFSVNSKPIPEVDLMATFRWVDNFNGSGSVAYQTNTFHSDETLGAPMPFTNDAIKLDTIQVGLPWALTIGGRYAGLLPVAKDSKLAGPGDPMDSELWDVEVDATYSFNERSGHNLVHAGEDVTIYSREVGGDGQSDTVKKEDLSRIRIDRHLMDSVAVRAAGSLALLPRMLAVHAGVFYETRGIVPEYANIDSFALARVGFGFGVMGRAGDFDLVAAYGHIFQETLELAPPRHKNVEDANPDEPIKTSDQRVGGVWDAHGDREGGTVLMDPEAPSASQADGVARGQQNSALPNAQKPERVVNAGKYTAAFNIISVGAVYHF
jgi:long-chain fatty acid transport protein